MNTCFSANGRKVSTKKNKICKTHNHSFGFITTHCIICINMMVFRLSVCNMTQMDTLQSNLGSQSVYCQQPTLPTLCHCSMGMVKGDWGSPTTSRLRGGGNLRAAGKAETRSTFHPASISILRQRLSLAMQWSYVLPDSLCAWKLHPAAHHSIPHVYLNSRRTRNMQ